MAKKDEKTESAKLEASHKPHHEPVSHKAHHESAPHKSHVDKEEEPKLDYPPKKTILDEYTRLHDITLALSTDLANIPHAVALALEHILNARELVHGYLETVTTQSIQVKDVTKK